MKYFLLSLIALLLTTPVILADELTIYSPSYFNEQDNEREEISYLDKEHLSFEMCQKNAKDISAKYVCKNSNEEGEIELLKYPDNNACVFNNVDLGNISCDDFTLEMNFQQDNRERVITRDFAKVKESNAITNVLDKDINDLSSLELSYYLLLHTSIKGKDNQVANDIYDKLKNQRDNSKKCWGENQCSSLETSIILNNVKKSGYSKNTRLLDDGKIYLESLIIDDIKAKNSKTQDYEIYINLNDKFTQDNECKLTNDGSTDDFDFNSNTDIDEKKIFENANGDILNFECDNDVDQLSYILAEYLIEGEENNDDTFSYEVGNSARNEYNEFNVEFEFFHEFSNPNDEITCDIEIDGGNSTQKETFTNSSSRDDMTFEKTMNRDFNIECDEDIDYASAVIYAGDNFKNNYNNKDSFSIDLVDIRENLYDFEIDFDYDFELETLTCNLNIDGNTKELEFEEGDNLIIDSYATKSDVSFNCNDRLDEMNSYVIDNQNRYQLERNEENTNSISFNIPNSFSQYQCIGEDNTCEKETSIYTLNTYDSFENKKNIESYIDSFIGKKGDFPLFQTGNPYEDAGRYLDLKKNEDLIESLKFLQNNDGSWGDGDNQDKVNPSIWAKLGLENHENSEHVEDAQKWIYEKEPQNGWGNIKTNSLAYLAIQDQVKPYLDIEPITNINGNTTLIVKNPSIFNLENIELSFSKSLQNNLLFKEDLGTLRQNQKLNISIRPSDSMQSESVSGKIYINSITNDNSQEILELPVIIKKDFPFALKKTKVSFTQENKNIKFSLNHNSQESYLYNCEISTPINLNASPVIIDQNTNSFTIKNTNNVTGKSSIELKCSGEEGEKTLKEDISVTKNKKKFEVKGEVVIEGTADKAIEITNLDETQQLVDFKLSNSLKQYISLPEPNKMLALNETRNMFLTINKTSFNELNQSVKGKLTISGNLYEKDVDILVDKSSSNGGLSWIWWVLILLVLGFAILLIVRYIQLQREEQSEEEYENDGEEEVVLD